MSQVELRFIVSGITQGTIVRPLCIFCRFAPIFLGGGAYIVHESKQNHFYVLSEAYFEFLK